MRSLWFLVFFSGCQCLVPVDDRPSDAGRDAGQLDAGQADAGTVDAGLTPQCVRASDCAPIDGGVPFCGGLAMSCIDGKCVAECETEAPRVCTRSDRCLSCDGGTPTCALCRAMGCQFAIEVVSGTCPPSFRPGADVLGRCNGQIRIDGGLVGTWVGDLDDQASIIDIPSLGGTCVGRDLFTGARRTLVSCPVCTFIAFGCD